MAVRRIRGDALAKPNHRIRRNPQQRFQAPKIFCAEDFLDPPAKPMDWLVPGLQPHQGLSFIPSTHVGCDDAWRSTLGKDRVPEMRSSASAVGEDVSRLVG